MADKEVKTGTRKARGKATKETPQETPRTEDKRTEKRPSGLVIVHS